MMNVWILDRSESDAAELIGALPSLMYSVDVWVDHGRMLEALSERSPDLVVLEHGCMIAGRFGHLHPRRRNVIQVVVAMRGQLDVFDWKAIEVLARYIPWQVRAEDPAGQKERLVMLLVQLLDAIVDCVPVAHIGVSQVQGQWYVVTLVFFGPAG